MGFRERPNSCDKRLVVPTTKNSDGAGNSHGNLNILNIRYTVILYYSGYNRIQCSTFCTLMTQ